MGVEDELEKIKNIVSTIQAVLQDAAEQQSHNHQVRDWLEKLKDAVYEADDMLSEFSTEASRRRAPTGNKITKEVRTFFSSSNPLAFRRKMSRKIKAMRQKLNAIAEDRKMFHLKEYHVEMNVASRKREASHSFLREEQVIGREEDKDAIIELLLESNLEENVSVIPIVGMGGIGKTTLAQFVYNDEKVKRYFELKMWVCVSDVFDLTIMMKKIIASATDNKPGNLEMDQLQNRLRKEIDQKKYLLVLDDVWNEDGEKWLNLKSLLVGGLKGSKIIITTRTRLVAEIKHTVSPYLLKGLSEKQSWSLLQNVAFRKGEETNNRKLVTIGREIADICRGVPLTVKFIGSVLRFKETEFEWSCVKDNILRNVTQQENSTLLSIIKLSYDNLPLHLKSCFAFCSLFPKDYEIDKMTLIQLWIAQGLIQPLNKNQQLEDVANEYFKDLLWRSFFEEAIDRHGDLKYKMHDLIHDLSQSVASAECKLIESDGKNIEEKIHHVSCPFYIDLSFTEILSLLVKIDKIRTFLLTFDGYVSGVLDESMLTKLILSFKRLRALDLHGLKITRVPNSIHKLIHLKYLDLSRNYVLETLPDSVTRLRNLQTLKLSHCRNLKELPTDIRELVSLRHLDNSYCNSLSLMPSGLGKMTSLQTLSLFVLSNDPPPTTGNIGRLSELNQLNKLRGTLEIKNLEQLGDANSESYAANLKEKQHLELLKLTWNLLHESTQFNPSGSLFLVGGGVGASSKVDNDDEKSLEGLKPHQNLKSLLVYGYGGVRFSSWLSSLSNIVYLELKRCTRCKHLPLLSQLHSLESLHLSEMGSLEYISDNDITEEVPASLAASTTFFPSLKSLEIYNCPNLKEWWRRDFVEFNNDNDNAIATAFASTIEQHHQSLPSFPRLSKLFIQNCPKLTCTPLFLYLEEELYLEDVGLKLLQQTMEAASSLPSSSSSSLSSPLSKLKSMSMQFIEDLEFLPDEWVSNLNSLKSLEISRCPRLKSLSRAVQYLTSLEKLEISHCDEFNPHSDGNDDGMGWKRLNCLHSLTFQDVPKMKSLPKGLQHVTTLQELTISKCPNFMTLPEWTSKLTSLELLEIGACPNLASLPNGMSGLRSLRKLRIAGCPHLEEKCQEGFGEEWPKIAHVPNISNHLNFWEMD